MTRSFTGSDIDRGDTGEGRERIGAAEPRRCRGATDQAHRRDRADPINAAQPAAIIVERGAHAVLDVSEQRVHGPQIPDEVLGEFLADLSDGDTGRTGTQQRRRRLRGDRQGRTAGNKTTEHRMLRIRGTNSLCCKVPMPFLEQRVHRRTILHRDHRRVAMSAPIASRVWGKCRGALPKYVGRLSWSLLRALREMDRTVGVSAITVATLVRHPQAEVYCVAMNDEGLTSSKEVYAVFQGGGAKGVAYAGALRAMELRGFRFKGVAGSSAGAITACLVAAGLTAGEIETELVGLLGGIRPNYAGIGLRLCQLGLFLQRPAELSAGTLWRNDEFVVYLDNLLRKAVGRDPAPAGHVAYEEMVTFDELPNEIELNVVVVVTDVFGATEPLVLNKWSTPKCQVALAVAGSCAIPLALPPQFVGPEGTKLEIDALITMDGGVWANMPRFCFRDDSLRHLWRASN